MISEKRLATRFYDWEKILFTEGLGQEINDDYLSYNKVIVSDCDGILTDGGHYYTNQGKEMKRFGSCDKEAMRFMVKCGWKIIFVTDDPSGYSITKSRVFGDWDIPCPNISDMFFLKSGSGSELKTNGYNKAFFPEVNWEKRKKIVEAYKNSNMFVAFLGDSISDIPAGQVADIFGTTDNALSIVKNAANIVSSKKGGFGGFADLLYSIHFSAGNSQTGIPYILNNRKIKEELRP